MRGFPIVERFPMHWGDMDTLGHANNARYFTWFESARIAYFRAIGLVADRPTAIGPILATTTCDFLRPAVYPVELAVGARVPKVGNTSFTMEYALAHADDPEALYARGSGVVVLVDYGTMQKVKVPESIRDAIARLESCPPPLLSPP